MCSDRIAFSYRFPQMGKTPRLDEAPDVQLWFESRRTT